MKIIALLVVIALIVLFLSLKNSYPVEMFVSDVPIPTNMFLLLVRENWRADRSELERNQRAYDEEKARQSKQN